MKINIRTENKSDYQAVFELIEKAFETEEYSDHTEQFLVERLRNSSDFIPALSIIAEFDSRVVGHILLTKIKINNSEQSFDSLSLAPVSVLPGFQKRGIGGMLIKAAHKKAEELGHQSIILIGHKAYYPKFGYSEAAEFGIELPFDAPRENCMAIELVKNGLNGVMGMVEYPKEFYE